MEKDFFLGGGVDDDPQRMVKRKGAISDRCETQNVFVFFSFFFFVKMALREESNKTKTGFFFLK